MSYIKVVEEFLKPRKAKSNVIGAIVCGSFVTGNPSKHSDIDLHILLDNSVNRRERGNKYAKGYLIEYFVNPIRQHYIYADKDFNERRIVNAHMFATGKILFDTNGKIEELVNNMKKHIKKEYPSMEEESIELAKYGLRDSNDNLSEIYEKKNPEFTMVYYLYLYKLVETYSEYLQYRKIEPHKLYRFLTNKNDRGKYKITDFPDKEFKKLIIKAIEAQQNNEKMIYYKKITNYVLEEMGGFEIDGWRLRSKCE